MVVKVQTAPKSSRSPLLVHRKMKEAIPRGASGPRFLPWYLTLLQERDTSVDTVEGEVALAPLSSP